MNKGGYKESKEDIEHLRNYGIDVSKTLTIFPNTYSEYML